MAAVWALGAVVRVGADSPRFPQVLPRYLGKRAPEALVAIGDLSILDAQPLALFCSIKCPGRLILRTYEVVQTLREAGVTVISGFHSSMEEEALVYLLRGEQPVIVCPARGIEGMVIPLAWRQPIDAGRLLVLSPFEAKQRRKTAELAWRRNEVVAALAERVLIIHAQPESRMVSFARQVVEWGKPVLTLEGEENAALVGVGAREVTPDEIREP
jgi:predicted Rossmann fold nucleotide-binding protein DprA/Smf involved in DNA uptake